LWADRRRRADTGNIADVTLAAPMLEALAPTAVPMSAAHVRKTHELEAHRDEIRSACRQLRQCYRLNSVGQIEPSHSGSLSFP
jgi:hypothetical protein